MIPAYSNLINLDGNLLFDPLEQSEVDSGQSLKTLA